MLSALFESVENSFCRRLKYVVAAKHDAAAEIITRIVALKERLRRVQSEVMESTSSP